MEGTHSKRRQDAIASFQLRIPKPAVVFKACQFAEERVEDSPIGADVDHTGQFKVTQTLQPEHAMESTIESEPGPSQSSISAPVVKAIEVDRAGSLFVVGVKDVDHLLFNQASSFFADGSRAHQNAPKIGAGVRTKVIKTFHPLNTAGSGANHPFALRLKARSRLAQPAGLRKRDATALRAEQKKPL